MIEIQDVVKALTRALRVAAPLEVYDGEPPQDQAEPFAVLETEEGDVEEFFGTAKATMHFNLRVSIFSPLEKGREEVRRLATLCRTCLHRKNFDVSTGHFVHSLLTGTRNVRSDRWHRVNQSYILVGD